jgi:redox-sensitive bicupin YhaK (pirin superfamily)
MMSAPLVLAGRLHDLGGGFMVRRLLPTVQRQSVGPFVFFDYFGPVLEQPDADHDVRPHPHIGLSTVTYLFEGAMLHRDSLGSVQKIEPGAINWMTAGRGIVHSERRPPELREQAYMSHGIQLWAALPREHEEVAPSFVHTPASAMPTLKVGDAEVRVLVGEAFGAVSPVATHTKTIYLDVSLPAKGRLALPALAPELAVFVVEGELLIDGAPLADHTLAVLAPNAGAELAASTGARLVVLGGDALPERRFIWWNFVSSRKERIAQAAQDWQDQAMGQVPGETEFIPLPEKRFIA